MSCNIRVDTIIDEKAISLAEIISVTISDPEPADQKISLEDLLAHGYHVCKFPGQFPPGTQFTQHTLNLEIHFSEKILKDDQDGTIDLYGLLSLEDEDMFTEIFSDGPIKETLFQDPTLRIVNFGQIGLEKGSISYDIFVPVGMQHVFSARILLVSLTRNIVLAKGCLNFQMNSDLELTVPKAVQDFLMQTKVSLAPIVQAARDGTVLAMFDESGILDILLQDRLIPKPPVQYIIGGEDACLAYRVFQPANADCIVANLIVMDDPNFAFSAVWASQVAHRFPIRVLVCDLRGFGMSGGRRGWSSSKTQLYKDIRSMVRMVQANSEAPIFLAGYLFSGGLVLNYSGWRARERVDGYLFLATGMESPIHDDSNGCWTRETQTVLQKTIFKSGQSVTLLFNEESFCLLPRLVESVSGNTMAALQCDSIRRAYTHISQPKMMILGDADEAISVNGICELLGSKLRHIIKSGANHYGTLTSCHTDIGQWIVGLQSDHPFLSSATIRASLNSRDSCCSNTFGSTIDCSNASQISQLDFLTSELHDWRQCEKNLLEPMVKRAQSMCLNSASNMHIEMEDGTFLRYQVFEPPFMSRTIACLVFLAPAEYSAMLPDLAKKNSVKCYRIDMSPNHKNDFEEDEMSSIWKNLCRMTQFVRANNAGLPIFLGGLAFGASLVLNYAGWPEHDICNGYLFLSPIPNPTRPSNRKVVQDLLVSSIDLPPPPPPPPAMQKNTGNKSCRRNSIAKSWISAILPKTGESKGEGGNSVKTFHESKAKNPADSDISKKTQSLPRMLAKVTSFISRRPRTHQPDYSLNFSLVDVKVGRTFLEASLVEDISAVKITQIIDAPVMVVLGAKDQLVRTDILYAQLAATFRPPFQTILTIPDAMNISVAAASEGPVGAWISQIAQLSSNTITRTLKDVRMSDLEPLELIGQGSFGRVWLVRHRGLGRFMALKVFSKQAIIDSRQVRQVCREREIMAAISASNNPFVVPYVGAFQDATRLFILMDFIIGGELYTRMTLRHPEGLPSEEVCFYLAEIIVALQSLHRQGIIYRDLKPENVLLDSLGHVRLADFGFAKRLDRQSGTSSFCGSPYYIAPEMLRSSEYTFSVDLWSLGVLAFEMLTGSPPFRGRTANEVYRKILFDHPRFSPSGEINPDAKDLIMALLDQNTEGRLRLDQVRKHRFFKTIDWEKVESRQITPPYRPSFSCDYDSSNFAKFTADPSNSIEELINPSQIPTEEELRTVFIGF